MQRLRLAVLAVCGLACTSGAEAAPFNNKTVDIEWTSAGTGRNIADNKTFNWNNVHRSTIYVSSVGRVFMRQNYYSLGRGGGSEVGERGPDQASSTGSVRFVGNALVGTVAQRSGAVQFTVSFDAGYSSCTLQVAYGRAGGAKMQVRGPGGGTFEVDSIQALQPSCRVSGGNGL